MLHRQLGEDRSAHRAVLNVAIRDGVARVTLDRPDVRNAFDDALIASLKKSFSEIEKDRSVRVVVLAGNGTAFCAGADLNWMRRMAKYGHEENLADARALADMLAALDRLPQPTIARVHGPAFAGGTGLVAACDIAVGTPEAKFCFSEAKLGLSPATISPYVMRAIGERAARRYFLTAEVFGAEEALRIGMLSLLVLSDDLDKEIEALLKHLLAGGPQAHASIKELVRAVARRPLDEALVADTARRIAEIRASAEGKEGIASFLEKRKAAWCSPRS
jgi:methylglutaconyl-CoA hydratase